MTEPTAEGTIVLTDQAAALAAVNALWSSLDDQSDNRRYISIEEWVASAGDLNEIGDLPDGRLQIDFIDAEKDEQVFERELQAIAPFVADYTVDEHGTPATGVLIFEVAHDDNYRCVFHAGTMVTQSPETEWPALPATADGPTGPPVLVYVAAHRDTAMVATERVESVQLNANHPTTIATYLAHYGKIGRPDVVAKIRELLVYDTRHAAGAFTEEVCAKIDEEVGLMEAGTRVDGIKLSMKERLYLAGLLASDDTARAPAIIGEAWAHDLDYQGLLDRLLWQKRGVDLSATVDNAELTT